MTKSYEYFPVQFRIYSTFTGGKKKGQPNPETFHTLTLMRLIDYNNHANTESVGQTLKRAKTMIDQAHTKIVLTNPGKETDWEREARYEKHGLEVVSSNEEEHSSELRSSPKDGDRNAAPKGEEAPSAALEAGDTTFVTGEAVAA